MTRNALLTACAYLALLCLAPPCAMAQSSAHAAPPLVPMAQLQAMAVQWSQHSDTTIECDGPKKFAQLLEKGGTKVAKGTEVNGFVEHPLNPDGTVDDTHFIDTIHLPSALCLAMRTVRRGDTFLAAKGYQAFLHETQHLALNGDNEAEVECTASKNYWPFVQPLHLAGHLDRDLLSNMRYFHSVTLPNYRKIC